MDLHTLKGIISIERNMLPTPENILEFWFNPDSEPNWFAENKSFDKELTLRFGLTHEMARDGELDDWQNEPHSMLALIIILDQFSRNMFRGSPSAFASDEKAIRLTMKGLERGYDKTLSNKQKLFFYMPLMHSENIEDQELLLKLLKQEGLNEYIHYAEQHYDIIRKHGRFIHRDKLLNRRPH